MRLINNLKVTTWQTAEKYQALAFSTSEAELCAAKDVLKQEGYTVRIESFSIGIFCLEAEQLKSEVLQ